MQPFIQVLHAKDHWVTITNYNPFFDPQFSLGLWFVYDSLNRPDFYLPFLKPALKRLSFNANRFVVRTCKLTPQYGYTDCGLFALGYAIAIAERKDPAKIAFNQSVMQHQFNWMIEKSIVIQFNHSMIDNDPVYTEHEIDTSDVNLIY